MRRRRGSGEREATWLESKKNASAVLFWAAVDPLQAFHCLAGRLGAPKVYSKRRRRATIVCDQKNPRQQKLSDLYMFCAPNAKGLTAE